MLMLSIRFQKVNRWWVGDKNLTKLKTFEKKFGKLKGY